MIERFANWYLIQRITAMQRRIDRLRAMGLLLRTDRDWALGRLVEAENRICALEDEEMKRRGL